MIRTHILWDAKEVECNLPNDDIVEYFEWPLKVIAAVGKLSRTVAWKIKHLAHTEHFSNGPIWYIRRFLILKSLFDIELANVGNRYVNQWSIYRCYVFNYYLPNSYIAYSMGQIIKPICVCVCQTQIGFITVSYTHLTLPTNREV